MQSIQKLHELRAILTNYDLMYHVFKEPLISDAQYDIYKRDYERMCRENPHAATAIPQARNIREQMLSRGELTKHDFPMLPLREAHDVSSLRRWFETVDAKDILCEPALRGIEVELVYVGGSLHKAVNYGDGLVGKDVTMHMYMVDGVPQHINETERVNIHGKVVISTAEHMELTDWKDVGPEMTATQVMMNMFRDQGIKPDCLTFIPHTVNIPGCTFELMELRAIMSSWGFHHMPAFVFNGKVREVGAIEECIESFVSENLNDYMFPTDGLTFRVLETQRRLELGYTSRYPEWAIKLVKGQSNDGHERTT